MAENEEVAKKQVPVRCQRIGCNAMFTEDSNPEGSCQYHLLCCKQRSHDFSLFLEIPGCETGKHTFEKPVTKVTSSSQKATPTGVLNKQTDNRDNKQNDGTCSGCRQGFFCSDHGSQARPSKPLTPAVTTEKGNSPMPKRKIDLNEPRTCRNKGCDKIFKEKDNHETACDGHPFFMTGKEGGNAVISLSTSSMSS